MDIRDLIDKEKDRQLTGVELIASENYVSEDVLSAMGSILTNKYSEGYVGARYYKGNDHIDEIEQEAMDRAKQLFGCDHVNVQPYSGSPANMAVYMAILDPGDTVMGMSLASGGHLTHGYKVSFSGKIFNAVNYGVTKDGYLDYEGAMELARKHKPKLIWAGATAYSREIDFNKFREIADSVGAVLAADIAHIAGLVAAGVHPSPVGVADIVTTTTHKTLRGPRGAMIMCDEKYAKQIDRAVFPMLQGGPHNHTTAAIAVALGEALEVDFKVYAQQIVSNSKTLASELSGLGYEIVSGGTENHQFLLDVTAIDKDLGGEAASTYLEEANISVNMNAIPFDTRPPKNPSGIRIGTAAITTRGLVEDDMVWVGKMMDRVLRIGDKPKELAELRVEVGEYMSKFPIPGIS